VAYHIFSFVANKWKKQHKILMNKDEKLRRELETIKIILQIYLPWYIWHEF
jgi:hypothetical protein